MTRPLWRFLLTVILAAAPLPTTGEAQPAGRMPRVGVFSAVGASFAAPYIAAGREGLHDLGYVEGKTVGLELRFAEFKPSSLPALAQELVALKPDVIVAVGDRAVKEVQLATKTIPIIMVAGGDPIRSGFVSSLSRPGGNITGLSSLLPEMDVKLLAMLKEAVPQASQFAVLWNPLSHGGVLGYNAMQDAAPKLGVRLHSLEVRTPEEIDGALAQMKRDRVGAFIVLTDPLTFGQRRRIIDGAVANRLPAIFEVREFVDDGALISYGPSLRAMVRRAAAYVDISKHVGRVNRESMVIDEMAA
jgi:putative tryptophan/tyrosine transport system substrate-binding protein